MGKYSFFDLHPELIFNSSEETQTFENQCPTDELKNGESILRHKGGENIVIYNSKVGSYFSFC